LADEILALTAVSKVDVEGMVLQLESALTQVDNLQIWQGPELAQKAEEETKITTAENWRQALNGMWNEIRSLVVIRHKQDGTAAVLIPEQRYFVYQNLRIQLETARFALLRGEKDVFESSLTTAMNWLQQYFVGDERDAMLTLISTLQQQKMVTEMPDISSSLTWLKIQGEQQ
jgi:uroporphyrin-3 C-methyltransferase